MDKSLILFAQKLVNKPLASIRYSQSLKALCQEVGLAHRLIGTKVNLSSLDLIKIENYVSSALGMPLAQFKPQAQNRMQVAACGLDEKLAGKGVFSHLLNFASACDPLPLIFGTCTIPKGCVLSTESSKLAFEDIKRLIIVENGAVLLEPVLLEQILPTKFSGSLMLYRGHGENLRNLKDVIAKLNEDTDLALFCDFDAAGLNIALDLSMSFHGISQILVPCDIGENLHKLSKYSAYIEQQDQLERLLTGAFIPKRMREWAQLMARYQIALMQEHMLAQQIALQAYMLKRD